MPYKQLEEPTFMCPECGKILTLNDAKVLFGLFSDGKLIRCSVCFERVKHDFWLRMVGEEQR